MTVEARDENGYFLIEEDPVKAIKVIFEKLTQDQKDQLKTSVVPVIHIELKTVIDSISWFGNLHRNDVANMIYMAMQKGDLKI